jgi:creatinine amidohydrolase
LSIGTAALTGALVEFVRHASSTWGQVLIINGHGGNAAALAKTADLMHFEGRSITVYHAASGGHGADPHAGYRETSLMLHLEPETVRTDLLAPGNLDPLADLLPQLRSVGVRQVSENGVLGDPTGASAEEGGRIFAMMGGTVLAVAARLLAAAR